jgi:hypothetical protein
LTLAAEDAMGGEGEEEAACEAGEGEEVPPAAAAAEGTELLLLVDVLLLPDLGRDKGAGLAAQGLAAVVAATESLLAPDDCGDGLADAVDG